MANSYAEINSQALCASPASLLCGRHVGRTPIRPYCRRPMPQRSGLERPSSLSIFSEGSLKAGHNAWLCVGNETKVELDELLGPDAYRVYYVEDARMHSAFRWIQARTPLWMGSEPLYYLQVLATQWRQRDVVVQLVKRLEIDVVHQPTPISPRVPSLLVDLPAPLVIGPMNGAMEYPPGFRFLQPGGVRGLKNLARGFANALPRVVDAKRQAECLIVANRRTEDGLPSGARGRIFRMVQNGVVSEVWARGLAADVAETVSFDRAFEIIFMGRLERWKGPEWLIEAVARACKQVDCRLKIVGDLRGERQRLTERVSQLRIESRRRVLRVAVPRALRRTAAKV